MALMKITHCLLVLGPVMIINLSQFHIGTFNKGPRPFALATVNEQQLKGYHKLKILTRPAIPFSYISTLSLFLSIPTTQTLTYVHHWLRLKAVVKLEMLVIWPNYCEPSKDRLFQLFYTSWCLGCANHESRLFSDKTIWQTIITYYLIHLKGEEFYWIILHMVMVLNSKCLGYCWILYMNML